MSVRKLMIDPASHVSVSCQCKVAGVTRSTYYYEAEPLPAEAMKILTAMDEIYTRMPFYGYRKIHRVLLNEGFVVGRDRVLKYKQILGLETFYPKKRTTIPDKYHKIYPYLLNNLAIVKPNQIWATDITYIRMKKGFCYLVAIIDWYSRKILSYRISNTLDAYYCIDALKEALAKFPKPEIFNTDQGSQFTSREFTDILNQAQIQISMDSKGRARDNIIIERFWRTIKYEDIYLNEYTSMLEVQLGIARYMKFYNQERIHHSLEYKTPDEVYGSKDKEVILLSTEKGQLALKKTV